MNGLIPDEDRIAYSEILYLIGTMDKSYIEKIPKELIDFFNAASMKNYKVEINNDLPRYTDNFKKYTVDIFNVINLNFWCENEEERRNTINYLLDKRAEFKLNEQLGVINHEEGNYFEEILKKSKEEDEVVKLFNEEMKKVKEKTKEKNEEIYHEDEKKKDKETIISKIKNIFKK